MATAAAAMCGVCTQNPPKYKCPRCRLPYCSLTCFKTHKETPCTQGTGDAAMQTKPAESTTVATDTTSSTVAPAAPVATSAAASVAANSGEAFGLTEAQIAGMRGSSKLGDMLRNKHLREVLSKIAAAKPEDAEGQLDAARAAAIFNEFEEECLRACGAAETEQS